MSDYSNDHVRCPACQSIDVWEHSEDEPDMGCAHCGHMWKNAEAMMCYKVFDFGCRACGNIEPNKMVKEGNTVVCKDCRGLMNRMVSTYKQEVNKPDTILQTICRIFDKRMNSKSS